MIDFEVLERIIDRSIDEVIENEIEVSIDISDECVSLHYEPWTPSKFNYLK